MNTIILTDKTFRITDNPDTQEIKDEYEAVQHTFDNIEAMKQFVEQSIRGIESNVKAGVYKDLKVGNWCKSGDFLIRDVQVIEDLPSRVEQTLITHRYVAQEKMFTL